MHDSTYDSTLISVVMPAHDEEGLLVDSVHDVVGGLRAGGRRFEVLVVENGSSDATAALATRLSEELPEVRFLSLPDADYGRALRHGFLEANGEIVVNFDVDYYDLAFLDRALTVLAAPGGPVIVVGSKRGAGAVDNRPWLRRLVTAVFTTVLKAGFGLQVSDTHGIKALRRTPLVPLAEACRFGTDLFDTELVLRAQREGLRAEELPVVVEERRPARSSIVRRIPRTIVGLFRLRLTLWRERARAGA